MGIPRRVKTLKLAAKKIVGDYGGVIPSDEQTLLSLPGVGPYTAAIVQIVGFSSPASPIDTNIDRLFRRYFGVRKPLKVQALSKEVFDNKRPSKILFATMDFSALVCKAKNPCHDKCPLKKECNYHRIRQYTKKTN